MGNMILARRSIRKFKDAVVSDELIEKILEAGCSAPSACNRKPYEIFVITNEEKLEQLNKCGRFTNMPSNVKIVVCGNLNKSLPKDMASYWIQDASAVTTNMLLMINELGLGACWCGILPQQKVMDNVKEILSLEDHLIPFSLINLGYPDEHKEAHKGYDKDKIKFIR